MSSFLYFKLFAALSKVGVKNSKLNNVKSKTIMMGFNIFKTLILNDFPKICAATNSPESLKNPKVKMAEITAHRGRISHNLPNEIKKRYSKILAKL